MKILDLSYNEIFYFEENVFKGDGLNNLLELYLNNNQLTELEEGDLDNLPELKIIDFDEYPFNNI